MTKRNSARRIPPRALVPLATCLVVLLLGASAPNEPEILHDEWFLVSYGETPVGYSHSIIKRVYEPQETIVTSVFSEDRFKRAGIELVWHASVEYRETLDGDLLSLISRACDSKEETVSHAVVTGDFMRVTTETVGTTHTVEIPWDPATLGPYAQRELIRKNALRPGGTAEYKSFHLSLLRSVEEKFDVTGRETVEVGGKSIEAWKGTQTQDELPNVLPPDRKQVWLDDDASFIRSFSDRRDGVTVVLTTRKEALTSVVPEKAADFTTRYIIESNARIVRPWEVKEALYRIEAGDKEIGALTLADRRQTIEERSKGSVLLHVRALGDAEKPSEEAPGPEFLASAPYIQCSDSEIVRLAKEAVGEESEPGEKARLLTRWVRKNIRKKSSSVGFASAKEVALHREGDCTEHAVLLAALLRAEGIPSRVVGGLVYWNGSFGYHMWTEAYLNDWTALDAALNMVLVDATHIKLADSALDLSSVDSSFLAVDRVISRINLHVVETHTVSKVSTDEKAE